MNMKSALVKLYSIIQKRVLKLGSIGAGSAIKFPFKIWNAPRIHLGKNVFIAENSFFSVVTEFKGQNYPDAQVTIQDGCCIGANFHVSATDRVTIGPNVLISDRVFIGTGFHDYADIKTPIIHQPMKNVGPVDIKEGAFIGINAVILPNVVIGKNSFVAASAVVSKSVPDYCVVGGIPARILKRYNVTTSQWE